MDLQFRTPPGATGGTHASTEIAATLRDRPGDEAVIEEHPLPTMADPTVASAREELATVVFPATAEAMASQASGEVAKVLDGVRKADVKAATENGEAPKSYASVEDALKAVLRELVKRVRARASSKTGVVKDGRVKAFAPAGVFGAVSRTEPGADGNPAVCVYAWYKGEEHALPADEQPAAKRAAKKAAEERPPAFPAPEAPIV